MNYKSKVLAALGLVACMRAAAAVSEGGTAVICAAPGMLSFNNINLAMTTDACVAMIEGAQCTPGDESGCPAGTDCHAVAYNCRKQAAGDAANLRAGPHTRALASTIPAEGATAICAPAGMPAFHNVNLGLPVDECQAMIAAAQCTPGKSGCPDGIDCRIVEYNCNEQASDLPLIFPNNRKLFTVGGATDCWGKDTYCLCGTSCGQCCNGNAWSWAVFGCACL
ncbi:hypothetical protein JKP88DRAFT_283340 [Tribonema minus]|uniref:Uncharacterized protein n=1 Tax=Tribonema minus TaxID=303371 RepID=A0A835YL61_9STRA|nr:hypothetical protein JKP88DRAFT_283340 [Tribonema minus]